MLPEYYCILVDLETLYRHFGFPEESLCALELQVMNNVLKVFVFISLCELIKVELKFHSCEEWSFADI